MAWLGLLAIWLATAAPVVSQILPTSSLAMAPGAWCGNTASHDGHAPATPHDHALEKCAYCALLGDSPLLGAPSWHPPIVPLARAEHEGLPQATPWIRHDAIAAAPRGPPVSARC